MLYTSSCRPRPCSWSRFSFCSSCLQTQQKVAIFLLGAARACKADIGNLVQDILATNWPGPLEEGLLVETAVHVDVTDASALQPFDWLLHLSSP